MRHPRNIVGPNIRRLRHYQGISQEQLAAKCQIVGWDISRDGIAKIEGQIRWVGDFELVALAIALQVPLTSLYPDKRLSLKLLKAVSD